MDSIVTIRIGRFPVQTSLGDRSGLGTQPCYEAPSNLRVIIVKTQWLTPIKWGCPHDNGPKLAVGQPNGSLKNKGPVIIHDAHVATRTIPNMTIALHATLSSRFVKVKISFRWNKFYMAQMFIEGVLLKDSLWASIQLWSEKQTLRRNLDWTRTRKTPNTDTFHSVKPDTWKTDFCSRSWRSTLTSIAMT